ncbi:hypothetical protein D3C83_126290 [compost metagenome]
MLAQFDSDLQLVWTLRVGSLEFDDFRGVSADENSNVFAAGYFHDSVTIGDCFPLVSAGGSDLLLLKLRP